MDSQDANAERCHGRAGTYEVWYLTVAVPARRQGYWIRYTSFNPKPGIEAEAHSALWAFRFDHDNPGANWGAKASFPLGALQVQKRPFALRDRKSTRLNSSHMSISYAVLCLKKKTLRPPGQLRRPARRRRRRPRHGRRRLGQLQTGGPARRSPRPRLLPERHVFFLMIRRPPRSTLFPYPTLFR